VTYIPAFVNPEMRPGTCEVSEFEASVETKSFSFSQNFNFFGAVTSEVSWIFEERALATVELGQAFFRGPIALQINVQGRETSLQLT
jgi:hypothetical protein